MKFTAPVPFFLPVIDAVASAVVAVAISVGSTEAVMVPLFFVVIAFPAGHALSVTVLLAPFATAIDIGSGRQATTMLSLTVVSYETTLSTLVTSPLPTAGFTPFFSQPQFVMIPPTLHPKMPPR